MTLKQLEYFLAIAENGSITKAANSLRISQPPLSLQLKGLEEELGCQLFIRDKKNMIITPKGILLRERAREIMDKVNETLLLMQSANEEERYTIHLGTISSICNRVLPDKVLKLKERYPHVEFVLHEGSTTSILDMLADGTVDFGIVREPFNVGAYSSRPIRDTALGEGGQAYFTRIRHRQAELLPRRRYAGRGAHQSAGHPHHHPPAVLRSFHQRLPPSGLYPQHHLPERQHRLLAELGGIRHRRCDRAVYLRDPELRSHARHEAHRQPGDCLQGAPHLESQRHAHA